MNWIFFIFLWFQTYNINKANLSLEFWWVPRDVNAAIHQVCWIYHSRMTSSATSTSEMISNSAKSLSQLSNWWDVIQSSNQLNQTLISGLNLFYSASSITPWKFHWMLVKVRVTLKRAYNFPFLMLSFMRLWMGTI